MTTQKERFFLALLLTLVVLLSACGIGSFRSTAQVLQDSSTAIKQLKAVHFALKINANAKVNGVPASSGSTSPTNTTINLNATGDEILPGQAALKVTLAGLSGRNVSIATIVQNKKVYIQNANRLWYVLDENKLFPGSSPSTSNPLSTTPDLKKFLDIINKNTQITDHGDESLNGENLRHITIAIDKNGLKKILESPFQSSNLPGGDQQLVNQFTNITKNLKTTMDLLIDESTSYIYRMDLWIDESTSYIHRLELKLNLDLDLSGLATPTPATTTNSSPGLTFGFDMVLDLSKFNDPSIMIKAPANAIPADNPATIFTGGQ